jgi:ribosome-associated toxin RatA of RatAB toxin-antitoxin module
MRKILIIAFLLALRLLPASAQSEWKLRTEKDGIKIYSRQMSDSKVKAIKVETVLNATAAQVVAVVMDVNASTEWVYHVKQSAIVKQVSPSELYYYAEVNLPWPAANRDFVAHLTVSQNPDTKVVTIDGPAVPGLVPAKKGIVRIENSIGKWVLTPISHDQVKIEYTIHVDPVGALPSWLVNMFATEAPLQIFKNMRLQLQKPVYRNSFVAVVR